MQAAAQGRLPEWGRRMTRRPGDKDLWWLFDAAAEAMLLADEGGAILARNASCDRLFGYAGEEWAGVRVEDLIPSRFRAAHGHFRAAFAAKPVSRAMGRGGEFAALRKDGSEFLARIGLSAVPGAEGPMVLAIVEDITAQRQTEEAQRGREALLGLAVRVTGLAAWEWDRDGDRAYLSPEWKAQIGYGDDELPGDAEAWRGRIHPDDLPGFRAALDDFRTGSRHEFEFKYRLSHRDGTFRWLQSRAVSLPTQDGDGSRLLGMQWDVTERERKARRVGEWRQEVAAVGQAQVALATAASVGHDLNQPLSALVSLCETALLLSRQGRLDQLEEILDGALKQADRASRVVPDALASLASEEAPAVPVDLNRAVREAVELVMADGPPGMRVVPSLPPESPLVLGQEIELRMVVVNLLQNSAEALAAAGTPGWPVMVTVGTAREAGMAQVSVKDHGPGLAPGAVERIFEPFFTTKPHGIGMGLTTSRRVIERLGGRLWAEGGRGAGFHFTLPLAT